MSIKRMGDRKLPLPFLNYLFLLLFDFALLCVSLSNLIYLTREGRRRGYSGSQRGTAMATVCFCCCLRCLAFWRKQRNNSIQKIIPSVRSPWIKSSWLLLIRTIQEMIMRQRCLEIQLQPLILIYFLDYSWNPVLVYLHVNLFVQ